MNYETILFGILGILGFGILVIVHELGHFIMAKLNGVKVEEFSVGMGPKLFSIKGKETMYSIRVLPIGGYVKMLGEEEKSSDPRAFTNLPPARRLSVVAAGPIMNIIIAIIFFAIIKMAIGYSTLDIASIQKGSPAETAGVKVGDKITNVNGTNVNRMEDLVLAISNSKNKKITLILERSGKRYSTDLTPEFDKKENRYLIGVSGTYIKPNFFKALAMGSKDTGSIVGETFKFFKTLFTGKADMSQVGGPISIFRISAKAAQLGLLNYIYLLAVISVQLAIFNVIPFPALDGGYIFLFLFEIISGKRVDDNKVGMINYIGFIFLMILMVLVIFKDIFYPIKL